jgi:hypothetical protein
VRRYSSYSFLTLALDGGEWSASCPGRALPPGKEPLVPNGEEAGWAPEPVWTHGLEEKSARRGSNLNRPARSQTLYCLSYRGSFHSFMVKVKQFTKTDIAQNYRILHRVVQCLSQHKLKISHHHHI